MLVTNNNKRQQCNEFAQIDLNAVCLPMFLLFITRSGLVRFKKKNMMVSDSVSKKFCKRNKQAFFYDFCAIIITNIYSRCCVKAKETIFILNFFVCSFICLSIYLVFGIWHWVRQTVKTPSRVPHFKC